MFSPWCYLLDDYLNNSLISFFICEVVGHWNGSEKYLSFSCIQTVLIFFRDSAIVSLECLQRWRRHLVRASFSKVKMEVSENLPLTWVDFVKFPFVIVFIGMFLYGLCSFCFRNRNVLCGKQMKKHFDNNESKLRCLLNCCCLFMMQRFR